MTSVGAVIPAIGTLIRTWTLVRIVAAYKNGGAYWNRGAYLQKHIQRGVFIRRGSLIGRRALNQIITVHVSGDQPGLVKYVSAIHSTEAIPLKITSCY